MFAKNNYDIAYFLYARPLYFGRKYAILCGELNEKKRNRMALCYKKLWKLLIDRDMTRSDLHCISGVSAATLAKMTKGECIASSIIDRICTSLKCDVGDIMEVVQDKSRTRGSL